MILKIARLVEVLVYSSSFEHFFLQLLTQRVHFLSKVLQVSLEQW